MTAGPTLENRSLVLHLVAWLAERPRPYEEVMAAWRTSCPRLTVWEDALDHGLVTRRVDGWVAATEAGRALLSAEGRHP